MTATLARLGQNKFANMLMTRPDFGNHSALLAAGPYGTKKLLLSLSEDDAVRRNVVDYIPAFLVSADADETVLMGFSTMTLVEADGTPVEPRTCQKAARITHWSEDTESSYFANIIHRQNALPVTGTWEALAPGVRFDNPFTAAVRDGIWMIERLNCPENYSVRVRVARQRTTVPHGQVVGVIADTLREAGWFARLPV